MSAYGCLKFYSHHMWQQHNEVMECTKANEYDDGVDDDELM